MMQRLKISLFLSLVLVVALVISACAPAAKQAAAAEFYKNNPVLAICNTNPGGGTDFYARAVSQGWTKIVGGAMPVENDNKGGGFVGINRVITAKPDGLTIGNGDCGEVITAVLTKSPAAQHKLSDITWLGWFKQPMQQFAISVKLPYTSMAEFQKAKGLRLAVTEYGAHTYYTTALVADVFKLDLFQNKMVTSISTTAEMGLAAKRGDLDGFVMNADVIRAEIEKGNLKEPFFTIGHQRDPLYPNLPTIFELTKLTKDQEYLLDVTLAFKGGKVIYTGKDVSADRVKFMQEAFVKIMADAEIQELLKKRWTKGLPPYMGGKEFTEEMKQAMALKDEDFNRLHALGDKYKP